jgi:hypothetical protein
MADRSFPPVNEATWRAQVEAELKGRPFDKTLARVLREGIRLQPLYDRADAVATGLGEAPWTRATSVPQPTIEGIGSEAPYTAVCTTWGDAESLEAQAAEWVPEVRWIRLGPGLTAEQARPHLDRLPPDVGVIGADLDLGDRPVRLAIDPLGDAAAGWLAGEVEAAWDEAATLLPACEGKAAPRPSRSWPGCWAPSPTPCGPSRTAASPSSAPPPRSCCAPRSAATSSPGSRSCAPCACCGARC